MDTDDLNPAQKQAAQIAHVLARAVRDDEARGVDVRRILRHEQRIRQRGLKLSIAARSKGAQASIDKYAPDQPPNNNSPDALHADHVYPITVDLFHHVTTLEGWIAELARLDAVVCVTAAENYRLEVIEREGTTGPEKYVVGNIEFVRGPLPWE